MAGRFSIEAVFKAIDKVTAPVSRMQNKVGKFTRSMSRGVNRLNRHFNNLKSTISGVAAKAGVALGGIGWAIKDVISVGADFGRAIGSAAAKFPDKIKRGSKEFKALEKAARDVGSTTEYTATQAAEGLNFMAKAGYDAAFSIKALPGLVDFATASEMDFAEAADIASDAIGAFGMNVGDAENRMKNLDRVMDVMSKTASSTNVSVAELFETVKMGAPIAVKAGQDIETFSAVSGVLAGVGIKATNAGTAMKNISLAMAGVGGKAKETFKALKIPLNEDGKMRDIADVFEDLSSALDGMPQDKVLDIMEGIFGKISLAAATNLLGDGADKIRELRKVLRAAGGSTKETAAFIRNDVKGSLDSLSSAIEGVKISIFSMNEGPLKDAIDEMTAWVKKNEELIAQNVGGALAWIMKNMEGIVKWGVRIGKILVTFMAFNMILKTLVMTMTAVNLVMALNPIGMIVVGIVAAIAAIGALIFWWDEIVATFNALPGPIQKALQLIFWPITLLIKLANAVMDNWEPIGAFFKNLWDGIAENFNTTVGYITEILDDLKAKFELVKNFGRETIGSIKGFFGFGGEDDEEDRRGKSARNEPLVLGPDARAAQMLQETRTVNRQEVTIKDQTGRAEVTKGKLGDNLFLQPTGAF